MLDRGEETLDVTQQSLWALDANLTSLSLAENLAVVPTAHKTRSDALALAPKFSRPAPAPHSAPPPTSLPSLTPFPPSLPRQLYQGAGLALKVSQTPEPTVLTTLLSFLSQGEGEAMETWFLLPKSVPSLSLPGHHWAEVRSQEENGREWGRQAERSRPLPHPPSLLFLKTSERRQV